jgi:hypothetical protein
LALFGLLPAILPAQGDRGTLTGTVTDASTAVVPGAKVFVKNSETGLAAETVTTETGNYTVTGLPAGVYDLRVESGGFKSTGRAGIRVQVAQTFRVDVALQIGATTESVLVTDESPLLRTENAEQSVVVSGDKFNQLPLNFGTTNGGGGSVRNWLAFIVLSPGVSGNDQGASVNGLPTNLFRVLIDGQNTTSQNQPDWVSTVAASSVESIGEFSVQTSNFEAQYAGGLGAMYNFTSKSGTNKLRGSVYDYFTNETVFNARRHFQANVPRTRDRKTDAGFTVGGPVWIPKVYNGRNRTFFYFGFEVFRNTQVTNGVWGTVPTEAYRRGDFSAALTGRQLATDLRGTPVMENTIYDPKSDFTVDGRIYRTPFTGNIVPTSRLDPVALKIQAMLPAPTNGERINNYQYSLPNPREQNLPSLKVDHNLDQSKRLAFYWAYQTTRDIPNNDPLPDPLTTKRDKTARSNTYRLNYDQTVTPTLVVHFGGGYRRFNNPDRASDGVLGYDAAKNLGLNGSQRNPSGFPRISGIFTNNFGGVSVGGGGGFGPTNAYNYYDDMLTLTADTTWIRGSHTYKAGATMEQSVFSAENGSGATGNYGFSSAQTGMSALTGVSLPSGTGVGLNYASFLLGATNSANVNALWAPQWRKRAWGVYIQDTWKVTRKLTVNYGARWDLQGQGNEIHWRNSSFGPTIPNPNAGNLPGALAFEGYGPGRCNCQFTDTYPFAISPRIGVAYQLDAKTVIRAGWGLSFGSGPNWQYITNNNPFGLGADSFVMPTPGLNQPVSYLEDGLTYNAASLYVASLNPGSGLVSGTVTGSVGTLFDRNGGRPQRVNQWNIALQRDLVPNLSLEVAYVGNRGAWLESNQLGRVNLLTPEKLKSVGLDINNAADRALLTSPLSSSAVRARGFTPPYANYPTGQTLAQSLRPFPQFTGSIAPIWAPLGNSWYDSMQSKLTKRYSRGLDLMSVFTWSKALALGNGANGAGGSLGGGINDQFNRANQKSLSGSDRPFVLTVAFNYTTPGATTNRVVRKLTRDWIFGGILTYRSGNLISVPSSGLSNIGAYTFQSNTRYNVVSHDFFTKDPGCNCIDPNKDTQLINKAAFQDVTQGQWGSSAPTYSDYRWVRSVNEQLSVGRSFPIGADRRTKLSVRVEMFNAFNRVTLPTPSAGNPAQTSTFDSTGRQTGGFGFINVVNGTGGARNGQGVVRFEW